MASGQAKKNPKPPPLKIPGYATAHIHTKYFKCFEIKFETNEPLTDVITANV
jgi:hypothetical protein